MCAILINFFSEATIDHISDDKMVTLNLLTKTRKTLTQKVIVAFFGETFYIPIMENLYYVIKLTFIEKN